MVANARAALSSKENLRAKFELSKSTTGSHHRKFDMPTAGSVDQTGMKIPTTLRWMNSSDPGEDFGDDESLVGGGAKGSSVNGKIPRNQKFNAHLAPLGKNPA
jgi:hypothetical protein